MATERVIPYDEVAKHNKKDDCWVILQNKVWDLTSFMHQHPGGAGIIAKYAGKDGSVGFDPFHPKDILGTLPLECCIGNVDVNTVPKTKEEDPHKAPVLPASSIPPIDQMLNLFDFEKVAEKKMQNQGWVYYSSGSDDEVTLNENRMAFTRLRLNPRVLINVHTVDTRSTILGFPSSFPVYISSAALGRLAHPEGEVLLTKAAGTRKIIQVCPTLGSCTLEEMTSARDNEQIQFYQLYVNSNRAITQSIINRAEKNGCKSLWVTVDAPQLGRREKDMRNKFTLDAPDQFKKEGAKEGNRGQGVAKSITAFIDPSFDWDELKWIHP